MENKNNFFGEADTLTPAVASLGGGIFSKTALKTPLILVLLKLQKLKC
jgi:hypothetical protein